MCFCFKTPHLIHIVNLLALDSQPAALWPMHEWSSPDPCIFSISHITAFLHLRMRGSISPLPSGAISNSGITNRKHKNGGNTALNRPRKGYLFTVGDPKQKSGVSPCPTSARTGALGNSDSSPSCAHLRMAVEVPSADFGATNTF